MIAFHYPPFSGSSGLLRTLKFSQYFPVHGWQPIVLTANSRAYPQVREDQLKEIPGNISVTRAFAFDVKRLSIGGSYLGIMALPDRWASWWLGAVPAGLRLITKYRPPVIWSSYPIATAHLIAYTLHKLTGLPWVADFRDSMTEDRYPTDSMTRGCYRWIERRTIDYASLCVFTAPSAREMYLNRYPTLSPARCIVVHNGYDEKDFKGLEEPDAVSSQDDRPICLVHSGLLYPEERDPRPFFNSVARLKREGRESAKSLRILLRAPGAEEYYSSIISMLDIHDMVSLLPSLPYKQSLQECLDADGLLLFQAASCDHQIPAKAYEYLRLQRPILALTSAAGDTAGLLDETGGATMADLSDEENIYSILSQFLRSLRERRHPLPDKGKVQRFAREQQAADMAKYLDRLIGQSPSENA